MYNRQTGMEETYWLGTGAPFCMGSRSDAIKSAMMCTPAELLSLRDNRRWPGYTAAH